MMAAMLAAAVAACAPTDGPADQYATPGSPTTALPSEDGRYVFVSVTDTGAHRGAIQIFRVHGNKLEADRYLPLGVGAAFGLALLPGGRTMAVGAGDDGVEFVDLEAALAGRLVARTVAEGDRAGTFDVAATRDGRYVFAANEYGQLGASRGNVGIIAVHPGADGALGRPEAIGALPTGGVVPSLALSPDGRRLYVAGEVLPQGQSIALAGRENPTLSRRDCVQNETRPPMPGGLVTVIDTGRAVAPDTRATAVVARIAAGCSPVRIAENRQQTALFVPARGDDRLLVFDPRRLETDPDHALTGAVDTHGAAPVGVALYDADRKLAVANSDRFAHGSGSVALFDVSDAGQPVFTGLVPAGAFPRNLTPAPDGRALYVTNALSRSVQVVAVRQDGPTPAAPMAAKDSRR